MPISTTRQWMVKLAVVFGLCALLAFALPAVLVTLVEGAQFFKANVAFVMVVLLFATVATYVSSLSSSGVKALVMAGAVAVAFLRLITWLADFVLWAEGSLGFRSTGDVFGPAPSLLIALTVVVLFLRFGLINHRASDRSLLRIWRQMLWLCGSIAAIMAVSVIAR
jgi:hypothetical protein